MICPFSMIMKNFNILVADDKQNIRMPCREILLEEGYNVLLAENRNETLARIQDNEIDLILLDIKMPGLDGMEVLRRIRSENYETEVIIITAHGNVTNAIEAMKLGAYDFLEKPFQPDRLIITVNNCLKHRKLSRENVELKGLLDGNIELYKNSSAMKELDRQISKIAATECWILLHGETGSGKELVAKRIHRESNRANKPFVEVNCSAIPRELIESELFGHIKGAFTGAYHNKKGKFEQANGGTILLDEIGDMELQVQAKVLRVLENGEVTRVGSVDKTHVDVRVISATNKNL